MPEIKWVKFPIKIVTKKKQINIWANAIHKWWIWLKWFQNYLLCHMTTCTITNQTQLYYIEFHIVEIHYVCLLHINQISLFIIWFLFTYMLTLLSLCVVHTDRQKMSNSSQTKVTKMLLIVSTVFVLLNLPDYDLRIQGFLVVGIIVSHRIKMKW